MSRLKEFIKQTDYAQLTLLREKLTEDWSAWSMAKAKTHSDMLAQHINALYDALIADRYLTQEEFEGEKDFEVISTFNFTYTVRATSKDKAEEKLQEAFEHGSYVQPCMKLPLIGEEAEGDWQKDTLYERRW